MQQPVIIESVYFAGPDVFRADLATWRAKVIELCKARGIRPLLPCDCEESTPTAIRQINLAKIREASAVIANFNPFRGVEVDSGTAFEAGFAVALGKPLVGHMRRLETLEDRVERLCGPVTKPGPIPFQAADRDGCGVESFSLPANLMLAADTPIVEGNEEQALDALCSLERIWHEFI